MKKILKFVVIFLATTLIGVSSSVGAAEKKDCYHQFETGWNEVVATNVSVHYLGFHKKIQKIQKEKNGTWVTVTFDEIIKEGFGEGKLNSSEKKEKFNLFTDTSFEGFVCADFRGPPIPEKAIGQFDLPPRPGEKLGK